MIFKLVILMIFSTEIRYLNGIGGGINETELVNIAKQAAGVYRNANQMNPELSKTVVVTSANYGYHHFLHNYKCFMDRLQFKVLVFSFDHKLHHHITHKMNSKTAGSLFYSFYWEGTSDQKVILETPTHFRSPQFNLITNRKQYALLKLMELGFDHLFIDADIALIRDPFPYLLWRNVDYVHSHNKICPQHRGWDFFKSEEEGNTGFYYVRSNAKTIKVYQDALALHPEFPSYDDQTIFWFRLRNITATPLSLPLPYCYHFDNITRTGEEFVTCPLDGCMFSAGALRGVAYDWVRDNLKQQNEKAVTVHANYLVGFSKKEEALKKHGYWIAHEDRNGGYKDGNCKEFDPAI